MRPPFAATGVGANGRPYDLWFLSEYPRLVGLTRRVLDPDAVTGASLAASEELVLGVLARSGTPSEVDAATTTRAIQDVLDACVDRLVGHPGVVAPSVAVRSVLRVDDDAIELAELHEVVEGMRRTDRCVALLAVAAGFDPPEVALLLGLPPEEVGARLARVGTRFADHRLVRGP